MANAEAGYVHSIFESSCSDSGLILVLFATQVSGGCQTPPRPSGPSIPFAAHLGHGKNEISNGGLVDQQQRKPNPFHMCVLCAGA